MSYPPRNMLTAIHELADNLHALWDDYATVEATLAASPLAAANTDPAHSRGTHADPTAGILASHVAYWDTVDNITTALQYLRYAQRRINTVRKHHAPVAAIIDQAAKAARCDGSWDPTCTNNAVRNGRCWRCIKAEQRARGETG